MTTKQSLSKGPDGALGFSSSVLQFGFDPASWMKRLGDESMIEGVIFDMDGVLIDNVAYHVRAWQALGKEIGKVTDEALIRSVFGRRNKDILRALLGGSPDSAELQRGTERKEELYRHFIRPHVKETAVPGLRSLLLALQQKQVSRAVGTSGPPENVKLVLTELGLGDCFDAIVTGPEVENGKPAPDIFLLAAQRLGVQPQRCLVFEDSPAGIAAAQRAGCLCVALSTTHDRGELERWSPRSIVADFTEWQNGGLAELGPV